MHQVAINISVYVCRELSASVHHISFTNTRSQRTYLADWPCLTGLERFFERNFLDLAVFQDVGQSLSNVGAKTCLSENVGHPGSRGQLLNIHQC